jgi:hypothetical protein
VRIPFGASAYDHVVYVCCPPCDTCWMGELDDVCWLCGNIAQPLTEEPVRWHPINPYRPQSFDR